MPRTSMSACPLNKLDQIELSPMLRNNPVIGPMKTQPVERAANAPTLMGKKLTKAPQPERKPTSRNEAVLVAKANITRRNSLRKQREAMKG
jgi:hypothetical protein